MILLFWFDMIVIFASDFMRINTWIEYHEIGIQFIMKLIKLFNIGMTLLW